MLSMWWLYLMYIMGNYLIWTGANEQVLVMDNNFTTFGYT